MPSLAAATPGVSIAFKNNIVLGRSHYTDTSMKFQSIKFNMYYIFNFIDIKHMHVSSTRVSTIHRAQC